VKCRSAGADEEWSNETVDRKPGSGKLYRTTWISQNIDSIVELVFSQERALDTHISA